MALKESILNLNKALRTTLQNVPAVVDTLIRCFDEIGDAAEEQTSYSTDERVVGKWIDGSDVYEKTIDCGALPDNTNKTINHGIVNLNKIISIDAISNSSSLTNIMFPHINTAGAALTSLYVTNTEIVIRTFADLTVYTSTYVTLRYLKASASRSPENDTKNGGDDEPDVKPVEDPDVKTVEDPDVKTVEDPDVKTVEEPAEELKK